MLSLFSLSDARSKVTAPANQNAYFAQEYTLQCSTTLPGMHIKVKNPKQKEVSPMLKAVAIADEGPYECIIIDTAENAVIYRENVTLHVLCKSVTVADTV